MLRTLSLFAALLAPTIAHAGDPVQDQIRFQLEYDRNQAIREAGQRAADPPAAAPLMTPIFMGAAFIGVCILVLALAILVKSRKPSGGP